MFFLFLCTPTSFIFFFFFFNDTATTEIYTLSLHDALPICWSSAASTRTTPWAPIPRVLQRATRDRKSTRLNSSHLVISYAVFCLKKKKKKAPRGAPRCQNAYARQQMNGHPRRRR